MRRDPRMVERKKTGLAKARKAVCLLSNCVLKDSLLTIPTVQLGQALERCSRLILTGAQLSSLIIYYTIWIPVLVRKE